jgi:hypothetical protein
VAVRSEAGIVFARSNTVVVGSNLTRGRDICAFILCVGSGLVTG